MVVLGSGSSPMEFCFGLPVFPGVEFGVVLFNEADGSDTADGLNDGKLDGIADGFADWKLDGIADGFADGKLDGNADDFADGEFVDNTDGFSDDCFADVDFIGLDVGDFDGTTDGFSDENGVGNADGFADVVQVSQQKILTAGLRHNFWKFFLLPIFSQDFVSFLSFHKYFISPSLLSVHAPSNTLVRRNGVTLRADITWR